MMRKIAYVINFIVKGGPSAVVLNMIHNLDRTEYEPVLITLFQGNSPEIIEQEKKHGLQIIECGHRSRMKFILHGLSEYKKILERESVKDIAPKNSKKCLNIRLGFSRIEEEQVIQEKGLVNDYRRFCDKYKSSREAQKYKLWYDICEKGIYYVYIPKV